MSFQQKLLKDLASLQQYYSLSKWILRIFLVIYAVTNYGYRLTEPSLSSEYFYLAIIYIFFTSLLFIGGFGRTSDLTRLSALALFFASIIHLIASLLIYKKIDDLYSAKLLFLGIVIYFLTSSKRFERHKKSTSADSLFDEDEGNHPLILR